MIEVAGYRHAELRLGSMLRIAFDEARNRKPVRSWDRNLIHRRSARYLLACNSYSRLLWADAFCSGLSDVFDLDQDDRLLDVTCH
jgi:hypothetical protein